MDKLKAAKMNEQELDTVAGGQTYWYTRITGSWKDPVTGMMFSDGYLIRGKNIATDETTSSFWLQANQWEEWKETMEWRGHTVLEGDSNPGGIDSKPAAETN